MIKHFISYLIYIQIWLNLLMDVWHFGCIEKLLEKTLLSVGCYVFCFFFQICIRFSVFLNLIFQNNKEIWSYNVHSVVNN